SNVRGAGKGLLAAVAGIIVTGSQIPTRNYPQGRYGVDVEEMRKAITAVAVAGDRMVLLDNLDGRLGDPVLDPALTTTFSQDRLPGHTTTLRPPLRGTWWARGNNATVGADTSRRVLPIRLESPEERPENRTEFRHEDLLAWVRQERRRLLTAALTILAGYCHA